MFSLDKSNSTGMVRYGKIQFPTGHAIYLTPNVLKRGSLSVLDREKYINAVHCMQMLPPVLSPKEYPGVRHRMDDFTVYADSPETMNLLLIIEN